MNVILDYLLKSASGTLLLYLCFLILFRRDTFYHRNRILLFCSMVIPLIMPLIKFPGNKKEFIQKAEPIMGVGVKALHSAIVTGNTFKPPVNSFDLKELFVGIWLFIALVLVTRILAGILKTFSIIRNGTLVSDKFPKLVVIEDDFSPFSFYPYAVIPRKIMDGDNSEDIIAHEKVHLRQGHTFDLLACEFFSAIFWFNPASWFLRKSVKLNHEYLADNGLKFSSPDIKKYQYQLLNISETSALQLTHNFNHLTKSRIIMINKQPTKSYASLKILAILPVMLYIFAAFSNKAVPSEGGGTGSLIISPRRIIFEKYAKEQKVTLHNTGKDSLKLSCSLINYSMDDNGSFREVESPVKSDYTAEKYIRFSPAHIILGPNEEKTVKIVLINTEALESGEYRSHLNLRNDNPPEKIPGSKSTPIFGYSYPVIIRIGSLKANIAFSDIKLVSDADHNQKLELTFNREGNMSTYGDLEVDHISPEGVVTRVGNTRGIAVYNPNKIRNFSMDLEKKTEVNYHSGSLHIAYIGNNQKIAEAELALK